MHTRPTGFRQSRHVRILASISCWLLVSTLAAAAGKDDEVFHDRFEARGQAVSEISQYGITWTFGRSYPAGRFANGDWWVVGPVTIIGIDPPSRHIDGRIQHGSMLNPTAETEQGYDSGAAQPYDAPSNVALDVSESNPLVLQPVSSLVSTITADEAGRRPQLDAAAVLTVLDSVPPRKSFRPPYAGSDKPVRFNIGQLNYALLRNLAPVAGTPGTQSVAAAMQRPWIDHFHDWTKQDLAPANNMPNYGRELAALIGRASLLLNLDLPPDEKETLLIRLVQIGIDSHAVATAPGQRSRTTYQPNGGHNQGRKWPILFAGLMLDDAEMKGVGQRSGAYLYADGHGPQNPPPDYIHFGADGQAFYIRETAPGEYNYGCGDYGPEHVGMPEYAFRYSMWHVGWVTCQGDLDWEADPYRRCCTANSWVGMLLAAYIMDAVDLWNHPALFDYQDRYMGIETPGTWQRAWDGFAETMWDTYRDQLPAAGDGLPTQVLSSVMGAP